jgi:hypothetical protein
MRAPRTNIASAAKIPEIGAMADIRLELSGDARVRIEQAADIWAGVVLIPKVLDIDPFHGRKSARWARIANGAAARSAMRDIGQAPPETPLGTRRADLPHPPGRALFAASGVARRLTCPARRRNALLTGGQNRLGERGQYQ